jgi:hypothetical protein
MIQRRPSELIVVLRSTLQTIQDSVWKDSPATQELKRAILRVIADLESERQGLRPCLVRKM